MRALWHSFRYLNPILFFTSIDRQFVMNEQMAHWLDSFWLLKKQRELY